jgi:hypothetical protein
MLSRTTAQRVAHKAAKKTDEAHGVFQIPDPPGSAGDRIYFSRKLNGVPPPGALLVDEVWPNGNIDKIR